MRQVGRQNNRLRVLGICTLVITLGIWTSANSQKPSRRTKKVVEKVTIEFVTYPARVRAKVVHGRKTFGYTPFTLEIEKDTGFRDIRVTAEGFLPLNTRFHTFKDHKRTLKLTKIEDANTLLGYKHLPVDAGIEDVGTSALDGGVADTLETATKDAGQARTSQP